MSEIVFQMVAFGFENVVVLVFDFPTGAAVPHNRFDSGFGDFKIGDEGIFVELFTSIFAR